MLRVLSDSASWFFRFLSSCSCYWKVCGGMQKQDRLVLSSVSSRRNIASQLSEKVTVLHLKGFDLCLCLFTGDVMCEQQWGTSGGLGSVELLGKYHTAVNVVRWDMWNSPCSDFRGNGFRKSLVPWSSVNTCVHATLNECYSFKAEIKTLNYSAS